MEFETTRTEEEVNDLIGRCIEQQETGGTKYPGMTYEDGIREALNWLEDPDIALDDIL